MSESSAPNLLYSLPYQWDAVERARKAVDAAMEHMREQEAEYQAILRRLAPLLATETTRTFNVPSGRVVRLTLGTHGSVHAEWIEAESWVSAEFPADELPATLDDAPATLTIDNPAHVAGVAS